MEPEYVTASVKPGVATSEFKLTVAAVIATTTITLALILTGQTEYIPTVIPLFLGGIGLPVAGYNVSRGLAKQS